MTPAGCHRLTRNSGRGQWARWKVVITVAWSSAQSQAGSHSAKLATHGGPRRTTDDDWSGCSEWRASTLETCFASSRIGLRPWFLAAYRMSVCRADTHDLPQILVWSPHLPAWERPHARRRRCVTFCLFSYIYHKLYPIGSMYAIYGNIYHQYTPNVSIYIYHTWILWVLYQLQLKLNHISTIDSLLLLANSQFLLITSITISTRWTWAGARRCFGISCWFCRRWGEEFQVIWGWLHPLVN